ncbi:restriction endonuclease subunit S [Brevundimonas sp. Leaf363]|uniref:restriction endonuclease subunit S n=1 Tax=Brevundimonas sp. Leaf363 TaxID=1736353 RepID=UPI0009EAA980|nr:restriction endonuclease subunit S [Brevundimonas sp. Leaf363]
MISRRAPWRRTTLDALGRWQGGSTPSKRIAAYWKNGDVPWVSPKDFGPKSLATSQDKVTELALADGRANLLPSGTLLIVTRSGILSHSLPTALTLVPVTINQDVKALLPGPGINPVFVQLQIEALTDQLLEAAVKSGTTVESVEFDALRRFPVLLTTKTEQDRVAGEITDVLARLERSRAAAQASLDQLDAVHAAALKSAFTGALTAGWRARQDGEVAWKPVRLQDVVKSLKYGSAQKSRPIGDVAVLRMGNIQAGRLDWANLVYTSDPAEIEKHRLEDGCVLFNRTNSPELVGKTAVYHGEQPAIAAGYLIVVRCGPDVLPDVLAHFLNSPAGRAYCWSVKSDGVSQSNINARKLEEFEFALPPLAEQLEIAMRLDRISLSIESVRRLLEGVVRDISNLRRQILTSAFRPDPDEDKPDAEVDALLKAVSDAQAETDKRIKQGRRAMPKPSPPREIVLAALQGTGASGVAFDDAMSRVAMDYEEMKSAIFALLQEDPPGLLQTYDAASAAIRLKVPTT